MSRLLLLLLLCSPVWAQDRRTYPRIEATQEFRPPTVTNCDNLTRQRPGDLCYDLDDDLLYAYDGAAWAVTDNTAVNAITWAHGGINPIVWTFDTPLTDATMSVYQQALSYPGGFHFDGVSGADASVQIGNTSRDGNLVIFGISTGKECGGSTTTFGTQCGVRFVAGAKEDQTYVLPDYNPYTDMEEVWDSAVVGGFTDRTAVFNDYTDGNFTMFLGSPRIATFDSLYFGATDTFTNLKLVTGGAGSVVGVGGVVAWQYWNGSAWTAIPGVSDGTTSFTSAGPGSVTFAAPTNWAKTTVNGGASLYFVRALLGTNYTTVPVYDGGFNVSSAPHFLGIQSNSGSRDIWSMGWLRLDPAEFTQGTFAHGGAEITIDRSALITTTETTFGPDVSLQSSGGLVLRSPDNSAFALTIGDTDHDGNLTLRDGGSGTIAAFVVADSGAGNVTITVPRIAGSLGTMLVAANSSVVGPMVWAADADATTNTGDEACALLGLTCVTVIDPTTGTSPGNCTFDMTSGSYVYYHALCKR